MKILVTGANGLLGQKLSSLISEKEEVELITTARGKSLHEYKNAKHLSLDISNVLQVQEVMKNVKPDVVINTAAMTMVDQCETEKEKCWEANVHAVEYLVKACEDAGSHLVHVSTDFIFDGSHGPLTEDEKPAPVNYYGESKLEAERIIMKSNLSWSILRTVLVYGVTPGMSRSNIILWVKDSLEKGKTIQVVNDQFRTPTLAEDLAMGCYLAATSKAKGIFNISGKDFLSPYEMAVKTAEFFKLDKNLIKAVDGSIFKQPARRPLVTGFIIEKARKELGYEPHSFEEGLAIVAKQIAEPISC